MSSGKTIIIGLLCAFAFVGCRVTQPEHSLNDDVKQELINSNGDSVTVAAGEIYQASRFKRFMLGDHYRDVWLTPVQIPIIDLDSAKQGLTILDKGGGMQTYSLKLKAENGRLYSLRSIQKDPSPTLPLPLQYSFADDVVQDQISASHPYGAFTLPPLGDAAGIYHTNPQLFYIPNTPELGEYQENYGGIMAMLEQDADENWSGYEDFGGTEEAISTSSMIEELLDNNDNEVDQENFARARLFDMWVGDWDRHEGQWRWATLEGENGDLFRPIPEDRDNIFFRFDGLMPSIINRKWAMRKFQDFDDAQVRDIAGLNQNAKDIDRRLITALTEDDWITIAKELQNGLTDEVIDNAMTRMPEAAQQISADYIADKLKERRAYLPEYARRYYRILARQVSIHGSDQNEVVEIERAATGTSVKMYEAEDDGEKKRLMYERTFDPRETDEIRIYTFDDNDFIYLSGSAPKSPLVRIIAGTGDDVIEDQSSVNGMKRHTVVYDHTDGTKVERSKETKLMLKPSLDVSAYDFEEFSYDYLGPAAFFGYNEDDGLYLGGGVVIKKQGFRQSPHASYHKIVANVAPANFSWNFDYEGDFKQVIGEVGVNITASLRSPNYFTNFFGYGNETTINPNAPDDFYEVRFTDIDFNPGVTFPLGQKGFVKLGPSYQYVEVKDDFNRFVSRDLPIIRDDVFKGQHFGGATFEAEIKTIDNDIVPEKGIRWNTSINWLSEFGSPQAQLSVFRSVLSGYYSIDEPTKITFASRVGVRSVAGDFRFYQASTLGNNGGLTRPGTLRGFERDRFSGRTSFFNNNEVRARLARIPFYYMPFAVGVLLHYDHGRVWYDGESSDRWHHSYGGGLWFNPLGQWVLTATYSSSNDGGSPFIVNLGFFF